MRAHRDEHLDLCAAWALGCLDEDDRRRLDEHLEDGCRTCEAALAEFSADTVALARAAGPRLPSRSLRDRVLIAAGSSRPSTAGTDGQGQVVALPMPVSRRQLRWATLAAASLLVFAGFQFDRAERMTQQAADERRWNAVTTAPGARVAEFTLTPEGVQALSGRAVYDPSTHSAVFTFDRAQAPSGRDYELWAIRGGKPAALGLLKADATGRAVLRVPDAGDPSSLAAFAVSLEPTGGSPNPEQPSGPVIMLGKL